MRSRLFIVLGLMATFDLAIGGTSFADDQTAPKLTTTTSCQDKILGAPQYGQTCISKTTQSTTKIFDECAGSDWLFIQCSLNQHKDAVAHKKLQKDVGTAIADGNCDAALKAALTSGDLDLATKVKGLCTPEGN